MSGDLSRDSGHYSPGAFGIVFGQMQLLLQLCIDRFTDQAEAIELSLSLLGPFGGLVDLGWGEQLQAAILLKKALEGSIIEGSIAKQGREVMRTRVQQFHEDLVV